MAFPFNGREFTFRQPDGTPIRLRGWGDQHYAVFETLDGYTVTRNAATGYFEVARVSGDGSRLVSAAAVPGGLDGAHAGVARGVRISRSASRARGIEGVMRLGGRRCDQRREERKAQRSALRALARAGGPVFAPPQRGTVGDFNGLCLLIDFSDEPGTITRDEVDRFCNQPGYAGFGNNGSVHDYYLANSIGRCRYTNIVLPYYRALHPKTYYTDPAIEQGVRARQLIVEALNHWKAQGTDFSAVSPDGGGFAYAMNVYYAGDVRNNWAEGLWPHSWHLESHVPLAPGIAAFDYQFTDMGNELSLGTFCHENGHMLCDYPDLYDYGYESSGVGAYCLMCAGANIDEKNPPHISAYLKRISGWANSVTVLEHDSTVTLTAGSNDFAMLAKGSQEYYLIENRQRSGRDAALPSQGLAIWHVDEEGDNSNEQMTPAQHYELALEQADGAFQLERQRGQYGDAGDLYGASVKRFGDNTVPGSQWWDGTASKLTIDDISAPGTSMSFHVMLSDAVAPPQTLRGESQPDIAIPDNRPAGITDTIMVAEALSLTALKIGVEIVHSWRGDLQVTLQTPWAQSIVLHAQGNGGNADDLRVTFDEATLPALAALRGRSTQGGWRLTVQDLAPADTGRLLRWWLEFSAAPAAAGPVELKEAPGTPVPDNQPGGIQRKLTAASAARVASIELALDIAHSYIGDLRVALRSPAGTDVLLHDQAGGSAANLVKTYTSASTPALAALAGQPIGGDWLLSVADLAPVDVGKLNSWRLLIKPA